MPTNFEEHFGQSHLGKQFFYFENSKVQFNPLVPTASVAIIDGFSRHFIFFYKSTVDKVYFIIFLLGLKEDAKNYIYEFEIQSKIDLHRQVGQAQCGLEDDQIHVFLFHRSNLSNIATVTATIFQN